jgi:hypothetical protein
MVHQDELEALKRKADQAEEEEAGDDDNGGGDDEEEEAPEVGAKKPSLAKGPACLCRLWVPSVLAHLAGVMSQCPKRAGLPQEGFARHLGFQSLRSLLSVWHRSMLH